jgi:hypothetical protein
MRNMKVMYVSVCLFASHPRGAGMAQVRMVCKPRGSVPGGDFFLPHYIHIGSRPHVSPNPVGEAVGPLSISLISI